jgi:hypothetical protein
MTKAQLLNLVLDQLLQQAMESPESFEILEPPVSANESIVWRPKITSKVDPAYPSFVDPSDNNRCVIVTYHKYMDTIVCHIGRSLTMAASNNYEAMVDVKKHWMTWTREYRKYHRLISIIREYAKNKETMKFLRKLNDVFPGTFEEDIFGKKNE